MKKNTRIPKIGITGKNSHTTIIPKRFVTELGFTTSTQVIIEEISEGILIKKEMEK